MTRSIWGRENNGAIHIATRNGQGATTVCGRNVDEINDSRVTAKRADATCEACESVLAHREISKKMNAMPKVFHALADEKHAVCGALTYPDGTMERHNHKIAKSAAKVNCPDCRS